MSQPTTEERTWVPLSPRERRVLGVLIEKQKTTPDYYPMTVAALVAGCNQKSNRDPVTNYDQDDVEEILQGLRHKGAVILYEGTGRVPKWKHTAYDWFGLRNQPVDLAVLAELMLRGPQTEGELRARAGRMDPIPDLATIGDVLRHLEGRGLVVSLSQPGQRRGVVVAHGLYPPEELEKMRRAHAQAAAADEDEGTAAPRAAAPLRATDETAALRAEVEALRAEVGALRADLRALKELLGA